MSRRLLAALTALALVAHAGEALAAFALAPHVCCCPMGGKMHDCDCPECARHRADESGKSSLGGCEHDAGPLALAQPAPAFFPAAEIATPRPPIAAAPAHPFAAPPLAPSPDVPTPPPLAI